MNHKLHMTFQTFLIFGLQVIKSTDWKVFKFNFFSGKYMGDKRQVGKELLELEDEFVHEVVLYDSTNFEY